MVDQQVDQAINARLSEVWRIRQHEEAIAQSKRQQWEDKAAYYRVIAYQLLRAGLGVKAIIGWLFLGIFVGGLLSHNLVSQAVVCNQELCDLLRFDRRVLKKQK